MDFRDTNGPRGLYPAHSDNHPHIFSRSRTDSFCINVSDLNRCRRNVSVYMSCPDVAWHIPVIAKVTVESEHRSPVHQYECVRSK